MKEEKTEKSAPSQQSSLDFGRIKSVYANNTHVEPSVWDLKVIFGQLEQRADAAAVDWHTSVTMPWAQAKILGYYLLGNIAIHERADGPVGVPANVTPPKPFVPSDEEIKKDPRSKEIYEQLTRLHSQLFD
jgi:hypothetical protein